MQKVEEDQTSYSIFPKKVLFLPFPWHPLRFQRKRRPPLGRRGEADAERDGESTSGIFVKVEVSLIAIFRV